MLSALLGACDATACDQTSAPLPQPEPTPCTIAISGAVTKSLTTTCGVWHGENFGIVLDVSAPLDGSTTTTLDFSIQTGSDTPESTYTTDNTFYAIAYFSDSSNAFRGGWCPDIWNTDTGDGGVTCDGVGVPSTPGWFTLKDTTSGALSHGTLTVDVTGIGSVSGNTAHVVVTF